MKNIHPYEKTKARRFVLTISKAMITGLFFMIGILSARSQPSAPVMAASLYSFSDTSLANGEEGEFYDEVPITVNVPRIGSIELQAIIYKDKLFLPIRELFDFLKIRNTVSPDLDLVEGFFIYPNDHYFIDINNRRIVYKFKTFELQPNDLIRTESNLYLRSDFFGDIFGLVCYFDFRNLAVNLVTKLELPAIREMQYELMRRNISRLQGEKKADTTIGRTFPLLNFSTVDWSVNSTQDTKGPTNTRLNLGLGGILAGGELNLSLNYFNSQPPDLKQQGYQWRFVNNNHRIVRQVTLGKIYPQTISSVFSPVIGMQVTNTPSTYRKSFGTFTVSNQTEPGWTVELYVNNIMINYTKADASGFYTFEVPMVYGSSLIKLRFYGPWGEEQMSEKYITVPFNFIPLNQLEYTVAAGIVEDEENGKFTRLTANYGLARRLTLGGGVEYLSSVRSGRTMPFAQATLVVGSHLMISAEQAHGVRSRVSVNYRWPSNVQVDIVYTKYMRGQTAIKVNHVEEKKVVVSVPLKGSRFNAFSRLTLNQFTFPYSEPPGPKNRSMYTSAEYLFSATVRGIISNLTTYAVFNTKGNPLVYSNLSVTYRLPKGFRISNQVQYEYRRNRVSMYKTEVEKNLFTRGFLNLSYQKDMLNNENSILVVGLKYNFSFAQTFFSMGKKKNAVITTQSARGSLLYDNKSRHITTDNQSHSGKGGIVALAFLDLNCNGKRDPGEPKVMGLKMNSNGGRQVIDTKDTITRISNLEAYTSYYLELDKNSFDNIAWVVRKPVVKVIIDPNLFKLVKIPVAVVGEVSGTVFSGMSTEPEGLGRMLVNIHDAKGNFITKILSEADGYFNFIGLSPGDYFASIDGNQLLKLGRKSDPPIPFRIKSDQQGDVVSDLRFVVY